jgi:hypothetical protein
VNLKPDANWWLLYGCLTSQKTLGVSAVTTGYFGITSADGLPVAGGITYEGTFTHAEAKATADPSGGGSTGGFALANVEYYFLAAATDAEAGAVLRCLERTYPGAPQWPSASGSSSANQAPADPATGAKLTDCGRGIYATSCQFADSVLGNYTAGDSSVIVADSSGQQYTAQCAAASTSTAACYVGTGVYGDYGGAYAIFPDDWCEKVTASDGSTEESCDFTPYIPGATPPTS